MRVALLMYVQEILRMIAAKCPELNQRDHAGFTPLHYAAFHGHEVD